jgi:CRP/FNR family transcriptional regulator, cyclic AMP receptor protein
MNAVRKPASLPLVQGEFGLARLRRLVPGWPRTLRPGDVLAHPGQPLRAMYVVVSGAVSVASTSGAGRRAILVLIGPGGVLGQESILWARGIRAEPPVWDGSPVDLPAIEVRTCAPCVTLVFGPRQLASALDLDPQIALWLVASLTARNHALERALARTLSFPLTERLLQSLRELAETHGRDSPDGRRIDVALSQEDLAAMVGATRESVNRSLRHLTASGLVRRDPDGAYVLPAFGPAQAEGPGVS